MSRAETFETLHRETPDPWDVAGWYERRKRDVTLASLPRERYGRVFEPGCSTGALSQMLASRCDELVAADVSETALEQARERLAGDASVQFRRLDVPREWPTGSFDLVVVSEVAYFLRPAELDTLLERVRETLREAGDLVLVDWRGPIEGFHGLDARAIHERVAAEPGLTRLVRHEEHEFLLEAFRS